MKKLLWISILGTILVYAGEMRVISEGKVKAEDLIQIKQNIATQSNAKLKEYKKVIIKDGGVEREINVEIKDEAFTLLKDNKNKLDKLNSHVGLLVKFKNESIDMDAFSSRFELKLKADMKEIGYYIFENKSKMTDIQIVNNILQSNIAHVTMTVKPNWPKDIVLN